MCENQPGYEVCFRYFGRKHKKVGSDWISLVVEVDKQPFHMSKNKMEKRYEHLVYAETNSKGEVELKPFLRRFLQDPRIEYYTRFGTYPGALVCPRGVYDLWTPFAASQLPPSVGDLNARAHDLGMILERVGVLTDHDPTAYNFLLDWLAQAVQYPEVKSVMVVLISKQGAGKGQFIELLKRMMGEAKVLSTEDPAQHVWGKFNGLMAQAFLVELDELGRRDFEDNEKKIKSLVTEPRMQLER